MVKTNDWEKLVNLPTRQVTTFKWDADYATKLHEGWTLKSGESAPARPWVWVTADSFNFKEEFLRTILSSKSKNLSLGEAVKSSFVKLSNSFGGEMQNSIQSPIWNWPRTTLRKSGDLVGSPRDIVDLGGLINSYSISFSVK